MALYRWLAAVWTQPIVASRSQRVSHESHQLPNPDRMSVSFKTDPGVGNVTGGHVEASLAADRARDNGRVQVRGVVCAGRRGFNADSRFERLRGSGQVRGFLAANHVRPNRRSTRKRLIRWGSGATLRPASGVGRGGHVGGLLSQKWADYKAACGSITGPLPRLAPQRARTMTSCSSNV